MTSLIVIAYAIASAIALAAYGADKRSARRGGRRISERTLHTLELLGGWPGALVAQQLFRHKRSKPSFFVVTWLIAAMHVACWWWAWAM